MTHDPVRHLVIEAGPGTGKTWTLMRRIQALARRCQPHQKVAGVTFTRRAAQELQERLSTDAMTRGLAKKVWCGTLHGLAWMILKEHRQDGQEETIRLVEPHQIAALIKKQWKEVPAEERRRRLEAIGLWKSGALDRPPKAWEAYQSLLHERGWIDFDDCLLKAWRLFEEHPEIGRWWAARFPYVCVDEFQDVNPIQNAWLKLWARYGSHLTVVGDPRQAIYGFRGADARVLKRFKEEFGDVDCISLNESRRCPTLVLQAAQRVLETVGVATTPLCSTAGSQGRLYVFAARDPRDEAAFIAQQIERLVGGFHLNDASQWEAVEGFGAYGFNDIAVLYRLNAQAGPLKEALQQAGIPFVGAKDDAADWEEEWFKHWQVAEYPSGEKVKLMTLHAAKGLEFRVVFIAGCEEGLIPLDVAGWRAHPQEEARLLFVGLTRAAEQVYLSYCARRSLYGTSLQPAPSSLMSRWDEAIGVTPLTRSISRRRRNEARQLQLFHLKPARRR